MMCCAGGAVRGCSCLNCTNNVECTIILIEGVSKLNQCGLRSALPLARARKPNNHIAQGSALGVECIY